MIYAINYADEGFQKSRRFNTKTAYIRGRADKVFEYSPSDLDQDFSKKNKKILNHKRGAGLWLWKPYIILKTLEKVNEGDYVFYADAGSIYVNKIQKLVAAMEQYGQFIMPFELPLLSRQFTKKETFYLMQSTDYSQNQCLAGFVLIKKNESTISFMREWLSYMQDERILSPEHFIDSIKEFTDFYEHREDQSVFSILVRKHNLIVFRDPSDYGDRPWQYASNKWLYSPKKYINSDYPKIVISNRGANPIKYLLIEQIKTLLQRLQIYTESYFMKKHKLSV